MRRGLAFSIAGGVVLLALAGCGRSYLMQGERATWRHEAEETCLKSGAVVVGTVQIEPIEGPGMCGMDFPLKVSALAEASPAMSYGDDLRPPASIPNGGADMPQWPPTQQRYAPPARVPSVQPAPIQSAPVQSAPVRGETLRWTPGPPGVDIRHEGPAGEPMQLSPSSAQPEAAPQYNAAPQYIPPRSAAPQTIPSRAQPTYPRAAPSARALPDDVPDDAVVPPGGSAGAPERRMQPAYNAPVYQPPAREPPRLGPRLGPMRGPNLAALQPAALQPPATLACPIVSALDRWVSEGVQPAALHWFGAPVTSIHQIGGYSCRGMVGGDGVSEHSFGNALDIAGFTLADGRKILVKTGWNGSPEEQGFLHDVQLYACETFTTVLAPGYNVYHYDHIHVDLMRRASGSRPCRPNAIPGEVVAARARAHYAAQHRGPSYTGSIGAKSSEPSAVPGADGDVGDADAEQPKVPVPAYLGRSSAAAEDRMTVH
jgi:hypothetical protein